MKKITIITPTFNRAKNLLDLYQSLINQSSFNFVWLIIDDGSKDNTKQLVQELKNDSFEIIYKYKENGGKHTALNLAFEIINTDLSIIVDSDDILVKDAIETIENDWEKYSTRNNICGLVYKKSFLDGKEVSDNFKDYEFEENYNSYVINQHVAGDKSEVFLSSILKQYMFPVYPDEKFVGEGVIWSKIAHDYNMIFINKTIYLCNYLDGGLTKNGRGMRIKNPLGGMYHANEYLKNDYSFRVREKNALLYLTYARFAKKNVLKEIYNNKYRCLLLFNIIPSFFIFVLWRRRYND